MHLTKTFNALALKTSDLAKDMEKGNPNSALLVGI